MKMTKIILAGLTFLALSNVYAHDGLKSEHYLFRYDSGNAYDIQLTDNTITWTGVEGSDKGLSETDAIKHSMLSSDVEIIQWNEKDGTFVTLALDRPHHKVISSGKMAGDDWLSNGVAEEKNN